MSFVLQKTTSSSKGPSDCSAESDDPPSARKNRKKSIISVEPDGPVDRHTDLTWLRDRLAAALPVLRVPAGRSLRRIAILIVDDARMTELHQRHLRKRSTTDVLTFDSSDEEVIEADIAICADVAARRAAELGHPVERELLLYAIHGLLHCLGFDDSDRKSFAAMHAEEDRILKSIGVGVTFAPIGKKRARSARR